MDGAKAPNWQLLTNVGLAIINSLILNTSKAQPEKAFLFSLLLFCAADQPDKE